MRRVCVRLTPTSSSLSLGTHPSRAHARAVASPTALRSRCAPIAHYAKPGGFNLPWHKKPAAPSSNTPPSNQPSTPPPPPPARTKASGFNLPWHKQAAQPSAGSGGQHPPPPPPSPPSASLSPPAPDSDNAPSTYLSTLESEVRLRGPRRGDQVFAYKIIGHETQVVSVDLAPGDVVRASTGALLSMSPGIEMETKTDGLSKAVTRMVTGESFFITDFRNTTPLPGAAVFGSSYPAKVLPLVLSEHSSELICQRGAFLVGAPSTEISTWFTRRLTAGFFGGEGFILQRLTGNGLVLLKGGGATIVKELAAGEELRTIPGSIIAMESSIGFDVQMVSGLKNVLFGQGLFLSKLVGPGTVWLQGLPFDRVVDNILYRMPPR